MNNLHNDFLSDKYYQVNFDESIACGRFIARTGCDADLDARKAVLVFTLTWQGRGFMASW